MNHLEEVTATFETLQYMRHSDAVFMRDFITKHDACDILEIGFCHGKSSAYFAAILEDLGRGRLVTIDKLNARKREPSIDSVLSTLRLAHRVTAVFAERSYTWELSKMIRTAPRPAFDLCYFDAGHTWDNTGFGFVLVDMLLRPGGWIIFDDLEWTVEAAIQNRAVVPRSWRSFSADERTTPGVRLVFDTLVPHLGYIETRTTRNGSWGIARKPLDSQRSPNARRGLLTRLLGP